MEKRSLWHKKMLENVLKMIRMIKINRFMLCFKMMAINKKKTEHRTISNFKRKINKSSSKFRPMEEN